MGNAYSGAEHEEPMGEGLCPGPVWAEEGSGRSPHLSDITPGDAGTASSDG